MPVVPFAIRLRRARGISSMETLIVLVLTALLAAVGIPLLGHLLERQKLLVTVGEFMVAVDLARSTARSTQTRVGLEPLLDGRWESGWRVWIDGNENGVLDGDEVVLREFARHLPIEAITPHFGAGQGDALSFDAVGNLRRPGSSGLVLGRLVFRHAAGVHAVCFSTLQVRAVAAAQCQ